MIESLYKDLLEQDKNF